MPRLAGDVDDKTAQDTGPNELVTTVKVAEPKRLSGPRGGEAK